MSKKSKHKAKGPRNPPQNQQKTTPAAPAQPQPAPEVKQEAPPPEVPTPPAPPAVEVKPQAPEAKPSEVKQESAEPKKDSVAEKKADPQDTPAPSGSQDPPSKPKRNRNRNKKNKKQSDEPEPIEEETSEAAAADIQPEKKDEKPEPAEVEPPKIEEAKKEDEKKSGKKDKKGKSAPQEKQENKKEPIEEKKETPKVSEIKDSEKPQEQKQPETPVDIPKTPEPDSKSSKGKGKKKGKEIAEKQEEVAKTSEADNKQSEEKPVDIKPIDSLSEKSAVDTTPEEPVKTCDAKNARDESQGKKKDSKSNKKAQEVTPVCETVKEDKDVPQQKNIPQVCEIESKASQEKSEKIPEKKIEPKKEEKVVTTEVGSKQAEKKPQEKTEEKQVEQKSQETGEKSDKTVEVQTPESIDIITDDSKNKNKKSKNKNKGKDIQPVPSTEILGKETKPEVDVKPVLGESVPAESKAPEEKVQIEVTPMEEKTDSEQHSNKADKKGKKGKKGQKSDTVVETKSEVVEAAKISEQKVEDVATPVCPIESASDDDILPSLASSIEKTLEQLIVCESDIVLDEQLKLAEDKKKADSEKHEKKSKKSEKKHEEKKQKDKEAPVAESTTEQIELKIQEAIEETVTKVAEIKQEEVIKPTAETTPQPAETEIPKEIVSEAKKDIVEHLKVDEKNVSKSPTRKEKRKKSPKPPSKSEAHEAAPPAEDKKCEITSKPPMTEPVAICAVPDDIINQLLSDVPPAFIEDNAKRPETKTPEPTPITRCETILEDIPKCEFKSAANESKPETSDPVCDFKLSESLLNVCQIESNIEKEMKKALEVALGVIVSDMPPIPQMIAPLPEEFSSQEQKEEPKTMDKNLADNLIMASIVIQDEPEKHDESKGAHKKKSKKHEKHDKHKSDVVDAPKAEEIARVDTPEIKPELKPAEEKPGEQKSDPQPTSEPQKEEPKPAESTPADVKDEAKPTDSPKPAKRNKDKKNKSGKGGDASKTSSGGDQSASGQQASHKSEGDNAQKDGDKSGADDKKQEQKTEQQKDDSTKASDAEDLNASEKRTLHAASNDEGSHAKKKHDGDDPNKRKSPPKGNQPKNLLGRSSTPAKSSKYDYKKEKNKKDPEEQGGDQLAEVCLRNLDPQDMPELVDDDNAVQKSLLPQNQIPATNRQNFDKKRIVEYDMNDDDDEEEFVYKYSFRTVFIANACHVCKAHLKEDRVVCRFCHLVGYCGEKHRDDDWTLHQSLCYAVSTFSSAKGQSHVYEDAKSLNGQDYRLLRMQAIVSCEKILKRKLCPWEQEALLYPRMCAQPNCREWRNSALKDCSECGQISYCSADLGHLPADHANWCRSYRLYYKLVNHQLNHGRLEPQLPNKIPPAGYVLPDKSHILYDDLYGNVSNFDDCHFATLTQLSTVPLTALYAYQKATQAADDAPNQSSETILNGHVKKNAKPNFCIHLVGAELQFEGDTLKKWECFFLHLMQQIKELTVVFIGPELNVAKLPLELLERVKLCKFCQQTGRKLKFDFVDDMLYHDYVESGKFSKPDIVCAFNPGFHRSTGYAGLDTWPETIAAALRLQVPLCVSAYTAHEMPRDLERVRRCAPASSKGAAPPRQLVAPGPNPYASLRPDRNFVSDDEMPLIFKNYQVAVVSG